MSTKLIIYRLISFILLPIAAVNGFNILRGLPQAVNSPTALLGAFLGATFVVYTFASFVFFIKGVQNGKTMPTYLRDMVRLNAYVDIGLCVLIIVFAACLFSPALQKSAVDYIVGVLQANKASNVSRDAVVRLVNGFAIAGGIYSALMLVHIVISLQLLKQHKALFVSAD